MKPSIKKLELKRETVVSLRTSAGIRTGQMVGGSDGRTYVGCPYGGGPQTSNGQIGTAGIDTGAGDAGGGKAGGNSTPPIVSSIHVPVQIF